MGFYPFIPEPPSGAAGGVLTGTYPNPGLAAAAGLQLQAVTPVAGFALQNATPTILSWTAPNDGAEHRVLLNTILHVTSAQTGGAVTITHVAPDGTSSTDTPFAGGLGLGVTKPSAIGNGLFPVEAGSTVSLQQSSAQSAGAALLWAELWGS